MSDGRWVGMLGCWDRVGLRVWRAGLGNHRIRIQLMGSVASKNRLLGCGIKIWMFVSGVMFHDIRTFI